MKVFIVLSALVAVGLAKPSGLVAPLALAKLVPGAPIGLDGRVVDTPEVNHAKAEHAAAHINEKQNLANEAVKSADYISYTAPIAAAPVVAATPLVASTYAAAPVVAAPAVALTKYTAGGAPIGLDGRVIDTPEVAYAKAEHAAAHINEKIDQSKEALKSASYISYASAPIAAAAPVVATSYAAAPVVATSYAAAPVVATSYAAAPVVATSYAAAPVVATPYAAAPVVAAPAVALTKYTAGGAPIGLDGRVVDTPEVAYAKAEHAAAHINERIDQGREILRNSLQSSPLLISSYAAPAYATGYIQHY